MFFRFRNLLLLTLLFFIFSATGFGQILNVEKSRIDKDSSNTWFGSMNLNMNMFNRNSSSNTSENFFGFNGNGNLVYLSGKHTYWLILNANYVILKRDPIARSGFVHLRNNLFRKKRLSYEFFTQAQYDLNRRMELRLLAGSGLRYAILKSGKINIYAGSGLMFEHEEWNHPNDELGYVVTDLLKSSNYISTRASLNENVEFNTITYYQVGYDESIADFRQRISGDINFQFKINNRLRFKTNFNCTYENRPVVPVTNFLYNFTNGIQANF